MVYSTRGGAIGGGRGDEERQPAHVEAHRAAGGGGCGHPGRPALQSVAPAAKVSGFVEADEIRLGSRVGGRALRVLAAEGDRVTAGQVLVELEPFDLLWLRAQAAGQLAARKAEQEKLAAGFRAEEVAQAQARRDELQARLQQLINGPRKETILAAEARLAQARADANYAAGSLAKIRAILDKGGAAREELDKAVSVAESVAAVQAMREQELAELRAGTRAEEILVARAQVEQAEQAQVLIDGSDSTVASAALSAANLLGKLTPYALAGFAEMLVVLVVMVYLFGVPIHGSLPLLLALSGLFLVCGLGLGLLISTIARTQMGAIQAAFIIVLPSVLLSGFMFPRSEMPWPIYLLTFGIPVTYFVEILRGIVLRGADLADLLPHVLGLAACTVAIGALSLFRFRKQLS